ncbi:MAG: endonuclease domain-containing protein [Candidatus Saganbacteria bacterium]|nr:endonuclease domain-containing protein [Candidatus Saganbacteria bacterium]
MRKKDKKYRTILAARDLRKSSTRAEILLWKYLSNRGLCGLKFRRQVPLDGFILDFFCPEIRLGIEIDGNIHHNLKEYDLARQNIIENKGINILRFNNDEVISDINSVLKKLKQFAFPSPRSGEGCRVPAKGGARRGEDLCSS